MDNDSSYFFIRAVNGNALSSCTDGIDATDTTGMEISAFIDSADDVSDRINVTRYCNGQRSIPVNPCDGVFVRIRFDGICIVRDTIYPHLLTR
ncbi:hypothetical protein C446_17539 [Halobiforma nitratireducens JCM 10879]|uniref:Uncharacterized protein n=1 Tax=Halobiforma nitratireducens JCM 10879 TaxID=1227454 RepID=M0L963_9EURY|nr:hypothetical protein C446_17539 [Halobiforma nitratireducens JCM 10879]